MLQATDLSSTDFTSLAADAAHIRNFCIIAHVDHGKTTLTDSLLASNGIISSKLAGHVRYMDSTEEEQARGITMKSSAIALLFHDEPHRELRAAHRARVESAAAAGMGATSSPSSPSSSLSPTQARVPYLMNLIDSPGHVDFSMDVCTAARLCDGALVVVDAVEGVCIQTHAVLRTSWLEGLRPILVINKIDRLIVELRLSPSDAYAHVRRIIEAANVVVSALFTADVMGRAAAATPVNASGADTAAAVLPSTPGSPTVFDTGAWTMDVDEAAEAAAFFDPRRGNVLFVSAIDGWAFSVSDFATLWAPRTGLPVAALRRALWGDTVWRAKSKTLEANSTGTQAAVTMMFEPLWAAYAALQLEPDEARAAKIVASLKLGTAVSARDLTAKDPRARLQAVMRAWLPLPAAVLSAVARVIPSPAEAARSRMLRLWPTHDQVSPASTALIDRVARVHADVSTCNASADADVVVYISKMFAVPIASLPLPLSGEPDTMRRHDDGAWEGVDDASRAAIEGAAKDGADDDASPSETFLAFARVFSGVLRADTPLFALPPRHAPFQEGGMKGARSLIGGRPLSLFLMMGRDLSRLSSAHAGQVVAIGGLGGVVLKTATLCSTPACESLRPMVAQSTPLVRVAVTPTRTADLAALERGLALLNASDPCVDVAYSDTGELTVAVLGELHLDRAVRDLETRFARVPITVSAPLLEFKESVSSPATITPALAAAIAAGPPVSADSGAAGVDLAADAPPPAVFVTVSLTGLTSGPSLAVCWTRPPSVAAGTNPTTLVPTIFFHPPSGAVYSSTNDRSVTLRIRALPLPVSAQVLLDAPGTSAWAGLATTLGGGTAVNGASSVGVSDSRAAFLAALASATDKDTNGACLWPSLAKDRIICFGPKGVGPNALFMAEGADPRGDADAGATALRSAIVAGFQLASAAGPIASEPLWGVGFVVEEVALRDTGASLGLVVGAARDGFRAAVEAAQPRLVEALYSAQLTCSGGRGGGGEQLGRCYGVLSKRRARIVAEDLLEGTDTFLISALLPVVESFGFADELRTRTSGAATAPQMLFSHWERCAGDAYGRNTENPAETLVRGYVDSVRERKGLPVWTKLLVVDGEKQRNRKY